MSLAVFFFVFFLKEVIGILKFDIADFIVQIPCKAMTSSCTVSSSTG